MPEWNTRVVALDILGDLPRSLVLVALLLAPRLRRQHTGVGVYRVAQQGLGRSGDTEPLRECLDGGAWIGCSEALPQQLEIPLELVRGRSEDPPAKLTPLPVSPLVVVGTGGRGGGIVAKGW